VEEEQVVKFSVSWLYRLADEKELAKGVALLEAAAPNPIFYAFHKDDNVSAASLLHPCKEHQEEVDLLLDRTKLEMQADIQSSGGPSSRALTGPVVSSQQPKASSVEVSLGNVLYSLPGNGKERECADQNLDPSKWERNVKLDDPNDTSTLKQA
jgi:hypothetical protein